MKILILSLVLMILTACGGGDTPDEYVVAGEAEQILILRVEMATDELLNTFNKVYNFNYQEVVDARHVDGRNEFYRDAENIVIWANQQMKNFSIIRLGYEGDNFTGVSRQILIENFGEVEELRVGEAFVVENHRNHGSSMWSGFAFTDENGQQRHFVIFSPWDDWDDSNGREISEIYDIQTPSAIWQPQKPIANGEISEYGRRVAADFLSGFTSIFTGVGVPNYPSGYALWGRWFPTLDEIPEIRFTHHITGTPAFFDRHDNKITDAPWAYIQRFEDENWGVSYSHHFADYFKLFDFDNTGIPDIIIHFSQTFEGCYGGFYRIFRYFDGEYRMIEMTGLSADGEVLPWLNFGTNSLFFTDENDRIIVLSEHMGDAHYDNLILTGEHAEFQRIAEIYVDWLEWQAHHWRKWRWTSPNQNSPDTIDSWLNHNPAIFGTDIAIAPLHPFIELGEEIYEYLTAADGRLPPLRE